MLNETFELTLGGCTPEPLMNYLKALGILRLVAEQKDPQARGAWKNDVFVLRSSLDREALQMFFLEEYKPTPIMGPWGARSGFYPGGSEKSAREALEILIKQDNPRFKNFITTYYDVQDILKNLGLSEKASDDEKLKLLQACRSKLPESILCWLDATYVLTKEKRIFPPLLGTGGNEGSGSYGSGFTQQLCACLIYRKHDKSLNTALFRDVQKDILSAQTPGHFSPQAIGGPNSSQGIKGSFRTNAWDYVLCLEGTCLWTSGSTRRLSENRGMASFPFTVNPTPVGAGTLALDDGQTPRTAKRQVAEMWLPLWSKYIELAELQMLLSEGRATVGARTATTGLDMAQASAGLGIDRGITEFNRVSFLMRNGQSFFAASSGRFKVINHADVNLLQEIEPWIEGFRRFAKAKDESPRFLSALWRLEKAIFNFCHFGGCSKFLEILCALGRIERELANGNKYKPIRRLSTRWLKASNDDSIEFELALALAGISNDKIGPIRKNLEPVPTSTGYRWDWVEKEKSVVWNNADLAVNLASVLARRVMDGDKHGCANLPLSFRRSASLESVCAFLYGQINDRRLEELLWGLMLIDHSREYPEIPHMRPQTGPLPRAYALLKLLFLPDSLNIELRENGHRRVRLVKAGEGGIHIKPEQAVLALLRAGHQADAVNKAVRRLRASGLMPKSGRWLHIDSIISSFGVQPQRLAAALLFPISSSSIGDLIERVIRDSKVDSTAL